MRRIDMMTPLCIANPSDKNFWKNSYVFSLGAYGSTYVMAYADSLDSAMDEMADWCEDHAPGHIIDDEVKDEYERYLAEAKDGGEDTDDPEVIQHCQEMAEIDTFTAGNASHYFHSWEVHLVMENPSRNDLISFGRRISGQ